MMGKKINLSNLQKSFLTRTTKFPKTVAMSRSMKTLHRTTFTLTTMTSLSKMSMPHLNHRVISSQMKEIRKEIVTKIKTRTKTKTSLGLILSLCQRPLKNRIKKTPKTTMMTRSLCHRENRAQDKNLGDNS